MYASQTLTPLDSPAAQAAFVAAMLDPAAYAGLHAVSAPIRCIETHVSWVFLTGEFAYKVKKPLRLSFIDYSTAARRAECCHEELRLNRRHAPGLYIEVVPIAGSPTAPRVGGLDGRDIFEHALRMVQFDPDLQLAHLLSMNAVAPTECAEVGARLAAMHELAARVDLTAPYGKPWAVHQVTLDNFSEIARLLGDAAPHESVAAAVNESSAAAISRFRLQRLQNHVEQLFESYRPCMTARRQSGRVREGHGDLHCGNVVRWQGALVAFDGLEFDPALRWIDIANDIAFLTMDLSAHGRDDLRREVLQAWFTATGDFEAVALLPYFEVYRALVRAKVAAVRRRQQTAASVGSAPEYLAWATARIDRPAPTMVIMTGLSGSGKTRLAQRIATQINALVVRSDIERKRLAGLQPLQGSASAPDAGLYSSDFNARTYTRLRECVASCLQGGASVIVDAANLRRDEREQFLGLAARRGARGMIVHCVAPIEVLRERVAARAAAAADASEATVDLLDRQPSYWEPFGADELARVVAIDTTSADGIERGLQSIDAIARGVVS